MRIAGGNDRELESKSGDDLQGSFYDDPGIRPSGHIFVGSKAPWDEITDELPQADEWPEGFGPDAA